MSTSYLGFVPQDLGEDDAMVLFFGGHAPLALLEVDLPRFYSLYCTYRLTKLMRYGTVVDRDGQGERDRLIIRTFRAQLLLDILHQSAVKQVAITR